MFTHSGPSSGNVGWLISPDPNYEFNKRLRRAFESELIVPYRKEMESSSVENSKTTDPAALQKQLELGEHIKKGESYVGPSTLSSSVYLKSNVSWSVRGPRLDITEEVQTSKEVLPRQWGSKMICPMSVSFFASIHFSPSISGPTLPPLCRPVAPTNVFLFPLRSFPQFLWYSLIHICVKLM